MVGFLAIFACASVATPAPGFSRYGSRIWQMNDGLPHNSVQAIVQTRDGYLWVGTQGGLARFDGVQFTSFDEATVPEIRGVNILGLHESRDGSLWIATGHSGVFRLKDGKLLHYGKAQGLADDSCLAMLFESSDGSLWIGTAQGLSRFKNGEFTTFGLDNGLSSGVVKAMCEDREGNLWLCTPGGVDCWKAGTVIQRLEAADRLIKKEARTICCDPTGTLWVGIGDGLNRVQHGEVTAFRMKDGAAYDIITRVFLDRQGNLWVGTYGGLSRFIEDQFVPELNNEGQPFDLVNTIFEDREQNLWVGSRDGLIRLAAKAVTSYTQQQGLAHNNVISVLEDKSGALWIGTWGGGLNRLKDGIITAYTNREAVPVLVLGLCEDRAGQLWAGADFDGGLFRFRNEIPHHYTYTDGLPKTAIRVIYEDRQTNLWVGTRSGLYLAKGERFYPDGAENGLAGSDVRVIYADRDGNLWVGTGDGLTRLRDGKATRFTTQNGWSHSRVISLCEDHENNLWIGTVGGGLIRFRNGTFTAYTSRQGLYSDIICEILEDEHGWLWMGCPRGIFRVSRRNLDDLDQGKSGNLNCISYGRVDGMVSELCNSVAKPAAWKTRDGRLWFATTRGLCVVDPNAVPIAEESPLPVFVELLVADGKRVGESLSSWMGASFPTTNPPTRPLTVAPGRGELQFHYTALSFRVPERNCFKYKLEGIDPDWVDAGTRRVAYYNHIYPGHYHFQVVACNSQGDWNQVGAAADLILLPHFWQTWWFLIGCALALMLGGGGVIHQVEKRKSRRAFERVERIHAIDGERMRIARDMHDELGSKLSRISFLSDLARRDLPRDSVCGRQIDQVSEAARDVIQTVDEIVWAVSPQNDTAESLVHYICRQAEAFFELTPVELEIKLPGELPARQLSAEVRHNLFCVVKEVLNNVLKHAGATRVQVSFAVDRAALQIRIVDNGRGFDPAKTSLPTSVVRRSESARPGTGIGGIRERMKAVQGRDALASQPGQGTRWELTVPLDQT